MFRNLMFKFLVNFLSFDVFKREIREAPLSDKMVLYLIEKNKAEYVKEYASLSEIHQEQVKKCGIELQKKVESLKGFVLDDAASRQLDEAGAQYRKQNTMYVPACQRDKTPTSGGKMLKNEISVGGQTIKTEIGVVEKKEGYFGVATMEYDDSADPQIIDKVTEHLCSQLGTLGSFAAVMNSKDGKGRKEFLEALRNNKLLSSNEDYIIHDDD